MWCRRFLRQLVLVGPPLVMFQDLVLDVTRVTAEADADGCVNTMQPAVAPRDWLLLGRWEVTTKSYAYRRGDVVVLASPVHPNEYIVRRITAIEGDLVKMDRHPDALRPPGLMRVPMGHCWVRTDQDVSGATDSGIFGPVSLGLIHGHVLGVVWPPNRMGFVASIHHQNDPDYDQ